MRHLRKYQNFFENLKIETTDRPDEKFAKQDINTASQDLQEYVKLKPKIDILYNSTKNDLEIEQSLKNLLNQEKKKNFGEFVVDYLRICRLQREVEDGRKSQVDDKSKLDDFSEQEKLASSPDEKSGISQKIAEIKDRTTTYAQTIAKKSQELQKLMSEHKKKMADRQKEIKTDIKEIQNK